MEKKQNEALVSNLADLLGKGNSHVTLDKTLENIPFELLGKTPENLPYNIWQLAQHIRIAQEDILSFCKDSPYESRNWPDDYWPKEKAPASESEWKECVQQIKDDRESFINLLRNAGEEIFAPVKNGDGQTLLREALVLADHTSYHTAEIVMVRRLLNNWEKR